MGSFGFSSDSGPEREQLQREHPGQDTESANGQHSQEKAASDQQELASSETEGEQYEWDEGNHIIRRTI